MRNPSLVHRATSPLVAPQHTSAERPDLGSIGPQLLRWEGLGRQHPTRAACSLSGTPVGSQRLDTWATYRPTYWRSAERRIFGHAVVSILSIGGDLVAVAIAALAAFPLGILARAPAKS
jgi:hypothetical protein